MGRPLGDHSWGLKGWLEAGGKTQVRRRATGGGYQSSTGSYRGIADWKTKMERFRGWWEGRDEEREAPWRV